MPYAPTLTAYTDASPCPRVEVFFSSFAPGTATVTVYRSAAGRQYEVRGAVRAATAGALTRIDFEAPFNTAVTYRAEMFDSAGLSLGFTDPGTLGDVIDGDDFEDEFTDIFPGGVIGTGLMSSGTWLHNPLNPQGAVEVELAASTGAELSRPVPGQVSYPRGRRVGVILAEPRRGLSGLRMDVRCMTLENADRVQALLGGYDDSAVPVLCIRVGARDNGLRIPRPMFMGTLDILERGMDVRWGGTNTLQEMVGSEAEPPVPGLLIPLLKNADLKAYYATNAALIADNLTNADVSRRYDLAGYAAG
jgi:hypothetical protein